MADTVNSAVFLSYAREDSDAARRIADALRSLGVEVWFDQNELRGGDAWDRKIRGQIKDCALFLPVISTHTQSRGEGYFRLEWKLAAERTHLMAEGVPFLAPIVIDDTPDAGAVVPPEFTRVQWTRLRGALPTPEFVAQVQRLIAQPCDQPPHRISPGGTAYSPARRNPWLRFATAACVLVFAAGAFAWWKFTPGNPSASGQPVVVLMDTPYADRVYDPVTLKNGGSNADDITDVLRGLPVTIIKEATHSGWNREAEVLKENPALIVMHRSAFFTFPKAMGDDLYPVMDNKLVAFLGYVATINPRTRFIVYSRHSWEDAVLAAKWRTDVANRFPVLAGRIETWRVPLDRATFKNPITAQELRDSVEKQLGLKSAPQN